MIQSFFDRSTNPHLYQGRPDLVIEIYRRVEDGQELQDVTLGEIKYTDSEQTFGRGLKELLEYIEFARYRGSYLDKMDISINGLIITDGVDAASNKENTRHQTTSELSK